jgi:hypothetical protein
MMCDSQSVLAGGMVGQVVVLHPTWVWLHGSFCVCGVCPMSLFWLLKGRSGLALTKFSSSSSCILLFWIVLRPTYCTGVQLASGTQIQH